MGRLPVPPERTALGGRLSSLHYSVSNVLSQKMAVRVVQASQVKASALSWLRCGLLLAQDGG